MNVRMLALPGTIPLWLSVVVLAWTGWNLSSNRSLSAEFEKIRSSGAPMRPAELAPTADLKSPNAAELFQRAMDLVSAPPATVRPDLQRFAFEWSNPDLRRTSWLAMEAWITQNRVIVDFLIDASRRPECRFDVDYSKGWNAELPSSVQIQHLVLLAGCASRYAVDEGRVRDAVALAAALFRLGIGLADIRISIAMALGAFAIERATTLAESILAKDPQAAERLAPIVDALPAGAFQAAVPPMLGFERAAMIQICWPDIVEFVSQIQYVQTIGADVSIPRRMLYTPLVPYFKTDLAAYCRTMGDLMEASSKPVYQRVFDSLGNLHKSEGLISGIGIPHAQRLTMNAAAADARIDLLKTALAGKPLVDRFSNQPLRSRKEGRWTVFYSVGENFTDDQGGAGDIAVRIPH